MHSYVDIKAAATKLLNDSGTDNVKQVATILITLADRTARLEERHAKEIEELKTRLRQLERTH